MSNHSTLIMGCGLVSIYSYAWYFVRQGCHIFVQVQKKKCSFVWFSAHSVLNIQPISVCYQMKENTFLIKFMIYYFLVGVMPLSYDLIYLLYSYFFCTLYLLSLEHDMKTSHFNTLFLHLNYFYFLRTQIPHIEHKRPYKACCYPYKVGRCPYKGTSHIQSVRKVHNQCKAMYSSYLEVIIWNYL